MGRTTIMMSDVLEKAVREHIEKRGETLTDFYNRAILNQIENDGNFKIRDLVEEENNNNE